MKRRFAMLLACLVLPAGLVTACGGDDEGEEGGGGASGGTINMGVLIPLTGELGQFGEQWRSASELAIEQANETGALPDGATVKAVVGDTETNPQTAVEEARKMIGTQDTPVIIGPTSGPMVALAPVAKRARVPIISSSASTVALNNLGGEFVYRLAPSDTSDGAAVAQILAERDAQQVGLFIENDASPISVGQALRKAYEEGGGSIVSEIKINSGQSSYRAEVGQMLSSNPEWIVCACGQQTGTNVIKNLNAAGYDGERMVTADMVTPEVIEAIGAKIAAGMFGETLAADTESPTYNAFAEDYEAAYGEPPEPYTPNTFDAAAVALLAMMAAGSTDGEEIDAQVQAVASAPGKKVTTIADAAKAIQAGEEIDYDGASGNVDLDDTGTAQGGYSVVQVKDGEWEQVGLIPAEELPQ